MKVLILGGGGMLGHKLWQLSRSRFDTYVTVRQSFEVYAPYHLLEPSKTRTHVDVGRIETVAKTLEAVAPDVVVNCVGVLKQLPEARDPILSIHINALFPHQLAALCSRVDARLIHVSTDCIFSGSRGNYSEDDPADPGDLYAKTKHLGEVAGPSVLTLRASFIGRQLHQSHGLVEWFLSHRGGKVQGYTNVIFNGLTTLSLGRCIADLIEHHPRLSGVYHVSSDPISKHDLLCLLRRAYDLPIQIEPAHDIRVNRSLDSHRFQSATGFSSPSWAEMVETMASDSTPYDLWRQSLAA
ncbi:MAG: SDR family oxidoreductase [Nitrospirae bacterium]|nr:SDR family oxidoreductase [Nitrospirota bacterium]